MNEFADRYASAWTALGSVLRTQPPSEQALSVLRAPAWLDAWPLLDEAAPHPLLEDGLADLKGSTESAQEIHDDQFRLIRGPGEPIAVPWASVHLSEERLLFDDATMEVRKFYKRFNLQAPRLNVEPDDHISLELDFLVELLTRGLDLEEQGDAEAAQELYDAHDEFCRVHFLHWTPGFFLTLTEAAKTDFYCGIGKLGQHAVQTLAARLEV